MRVGPFAFISPRVAGGRPFSTDPDDEVSRPTLTARAGPASLARLPVYPMRDGGIVGMRRESGDERERFFLSISRKALICLATSPSALPGISPSRGDRIGAPASPDKQPSYSGGA